MHKVAGLEYEERGKGAAVLLIHGGIIGDAFTSMMDEPALSGYRLIRGAPRARRADRTDGSCVRRHGGSAGRDAPAGLSAEAVHIWMRSASVAGSAWRQSIERLLPGAVQQAEQDAAGTFEGDLSCLRHWDFEAVGPLVTQPVLFVVGLLSAPNLEPVRALVEAAVPTSAHAVVNDADHSLQMTQPGAVARTIADFLETLQ